MSINSVSSNSNLPPDANVEAVKFYQPFLGPSATPQEAYAFINNLNHTVTSMMSTINAINEQANDQLKQVLDENNPL